MKPIILFLSILFTVNTFSQINVSNNANATTLAQTLAGGGVIISNATLVCSTGSSGTFSNAPANLGFSDGVILSTGNIIDIPNPPSNFASSIMNAPGDIDLDNYFNTLGLPYTTNDACVLEFDIQVTGDTLVFEYAFGSEEYDEWVCNGFNDIFAFFLSGPNPAGGNYTNTNVALLPSTNIPVSINTVNSGAYGASATCNPNNSAYFQNGGVSGIVYDGMTQGFNDNTIALQVKAATLTCQNYHFKLAIADGGDSSFDSGVFLKQGSFSSQGVIVTSSTVLGGSFNTLVEGCVDGIIEFQLQDGINTSGDSVPIYVTFGGNATNGVDYTFIPDTLWVQDGDSSVIIDIIALSDNITEGYDTINVYLTGNNSCNNGVVASIVIADVIPLTISPPSDSICRGDSVEITITGAQSYTWTNPNGISNPNSGNVTATPTNSIDYVVQYVLGNCTTDTIITIGVSSLGVKLSITDIQCSGDSSGILFALDSNGIGNTHYSWTNGDTTQYSNQLPSGYYCVNVSDDIGCLDTACAYLIDPLLELNLFAEDTFICNNTKAILSIESNLDANAIFTWSPYQLVDTPMVDYSVFTNSLSSDTTIYVTGTNPLGCNISDSINLYVMNLNIESNYQDTTVAYGTSTNIGVHIVDSLNLQEAISFDWRPTTFLSNATAMNTTTTPLDNVVYYIFAESSSCEDSSSINVWVGIDLQMPNAFSPNGDGLNDIYNPVLIGANVLEFRVYNNWGDLLHDDTTGWDGTYGGVLQSIGVYNYYIRVSNGLDEEVLMGTFSLVY